MRTTFEAPYGMLRIMLCLTFYRFFTTNTIRMHCSWSHGKSLHILDLRR